MSLACYLELLNNQYEICNLNWHTIHLFETLCILTTLNNSLVNKLMNFIIAYQYAIIKFNKTEKANLKNNKLFCNVVMFQML